MKSEKFCLVIRGERIGKKKLLEDIEDGWINVMCEE
jgi:hypothetical protein